MSDMKHAFSVFAFFAVTVLATSGTFASDAFDAPTDGDEDNVIGIDRPKSQKEFSDYIQEKYRGDYSGNAAKIEEEEAAWNQARAEWNESHPDDPVRSDEDDSDFDYGDDDGDTFGTLTNDQIRELLRRKDLDDTDDPEDYGGIGDGKTAVATLESLPEELRKNVEGDATGAFAEALAEDAEEGVATKGTKDSVALESALDDIVDYSKVALKSFSFDILSGGVNPASHSIAGLFAWFNPEAMPLLKETDEARKKLLGDKWTEYSGTIRHSKAIVAFAASHPGWVKYEGSNAGSVNWARFKHDVVIPGTIGQGLEEPETGWDWEGLPEVPDGYADEMDFTLFDWSFGGFSGGDSKWHEQGTMQVGPVIGDLHFTKEGLRFQYENDLSAWDLEYDDPDAIACLFVKDKDGKWIGGKFEWISSSRTTRSFENIFNGYNGWDLSNVPQTTDAAFVIVSKDGKWRSNVAVATWER